MSTMNDNGIRCYNQRVAPHDGELHKKTVPESMAASIPIPSSPPATEPTTSEDQGQPKESPEPGAHTPPRRGSDKGMRIDTSASPATSRSQSAHTSPTSPRFMSPTFSSYQHARKSEPHVCTRCHPNCANQRCDEHGHPISNNRRRRSSAASWLDSDASHHSEKVAVVAVDSV